MNTRPTTSTTGAHLVGSAVICLYLIFVAASPLHAATDCTTPLQTYYVPFPAEQIKVWADALKNDATNTDTILSVQSITITADDTVICYDHWEDGFDDDLRFPNVSGTTEVWGDGEADNGCAPPPLVATCTDANDVLDVGDVVSIETSVPANPRGTTVLLDGQDKFITSDPVKLSRAAWPDDAATTNTGSQLGGAVEVYDTNRWGTSFESPIGEDISTNAAAWEWVAMTIMSRSDGTRLDIDLDGDGTNDIVNLPLDEGDSYLLEDVLVGTTVVSDAPVQVQIITADVGSNYQGRWYSLVPISDWDNSYYAPMPLIGDGDGNTADGDGDTQIHLYNPGSSAITVNVDHVGGGFDTTVNVPAGSVADYVMPCLAVEDPCTAANRTAGHFSTSAEADVFYAVSTVDAPEQIFDWGYTLVEENNLSTDLVIGWAKGSVDTATNISPVWVTAVAQTTLEIDLDGDGSCIEQVLIPALGVLRITDNSTDFPTCGNDDNNQTGMIITTSDALGGTASTNITAVWGQDPDAGSSGQPTQLDMGNVILPSPLLILQKVDELATDLNGNGKIDPGDVLLYTIRIYNNGDQDLPVSPATEILIFDNLNTQVTYVPGTTNILRCGTASDGCTPDTSTQIADDVSPATTPFPLDCIPSDCSGNDDGINLTSLLAGETAVLTLEAYLDLDFSGTTVTNVTTAISGSSLSATSSSTSPVSSGGLAITKTSNVGAGDGLVDPGERITYTATVTNNGNQVNENVVVYDAVPDGTSYDENAGTFSTRMTQTFSTAVTVRDEFNRLYAGSDGSNHWQGAWLETDTAGAGPTAGEVRVFANELRFNNSLGGTAQPSAAREIGLQGCTAATLTYSYSTVATEAGDAIQVHCGGAGTTGAFGNLLATHTGLVSGSGSVALPAACRTDVGAIRFQVNTGYTIADEFFYADNVQVAATGCPEIKVKDLFDDVNYFNDDGTDVWGSAWIETNDDDGGGGTAAQVQYQVINGAIDVDRNGSITGADDGFLHGVTIIDGLFDVNNSGTITGADDGAWLGFAVINGFLDVNGSGGITGADDDVLDLGDLYIDPAGRLFVTNTNGLAPLPSIGREVDLSECTNATLDLQFQETGVLGGGDCTDIDIGNAGLTGSFTTLETLCDDYAGVQTRSYDIDASVSLTQQVAVRFAVANTGGMDGTDDIYEFFHVSISATGCSRVRDSYGTSSIQLTDGDPTGTPSATNGLVVTGDSINLGANDTLVITYDVIADDPLENVDAGIFNLVTAASDQQKPITAFTLDPVAVIARDSAIGDRVWFDVDGDGVQDVGEPGIANVTVELRDGVCTPLPSGSANCPTTTTDLYGNYLFGNLEAGSYTVAVIDSTLPNGGTGLTASPGTSDPTASITVTGSEIYLDADFGYTNASPTDAIIGDRVWSDADGDGVQDPGEPGIEGVTVELRDGVCTPASTCPTTTTNADGSYIFTGVTPGEYTVAVDETTLPDANYTHVTGPQSPGNATPPFTVIAGEVYLDADFGYENTTSVWTISDALWLDEDEDGIFDAGERPFAGIGVALVNSSGDVVATTVSLSDGSFSFDGVVNDTYTIRVTDAKGTLVTYDGTTSFAAAGERTGIVVSGANVANESFGYNARGAVGDTVFSDSDQDGVQDAGELGIEGVTVELLQPSGQAVIDGRLDLDGDGDVDAADDGFAADGITVIDGRLDLNGDGSITTADDGTWRGVTVIDGELDLNGGGVSSTDDGKVDRLVETRVTDPDGQFLFTGLLPGQYKTNVVTSQASLSGYTQTGDPDIPGNCGTAGAFCDSDGTGFVPVKGSDLSLDYGFRRDYPDVSGTVFEDLDRSALQNGSEGGFQGVTLELVNTYRVIDGRIDTDGDGDVDADDDGWADGVRVIDGRLDLDGDGSITAADDGTWRGITVVDGVLDLDGDATAGETNGDDDGTVIGEAIAKATTDADGDYTFTDVPGTAFGRDYRVVVTDVDGVLNGYELTTGTDQYPITVQTTDVMDVDFGYVRDFATGSIGNTLWIDVDPPGGAGPDGLPGPTEPRISMAVARLYRDVDGDGVFEPDVEVISERIDMDGDGDVDSDDDGVLGGVAIIDGYLDLDGDGSITAADDGTWNGVSVVDGLLTGQGDGTLSGDDGAPIATTVTDANGEYVFTGLGAGNYFVDVDETTLPDTTADGVPDLVETTYPSGDPAAVISLSEGEAFRDADFGYVPRSGTAIMGDFVWYDADSDGLQDPGEAGIAGVDVIWSGAGTNGTFDFAVYRILGGYIDVDGDGSITAADDGTVDGVTVTDGQAAGSLPNYTSYTFIGGLVDLDGDGSITSADDGAIAGGDDLAGVETTAADGSYLVTGLTPGEYGAYFDTSDIAAIGLNAQPTNTPLGGNDNSYAVTLTAGDVINTLDWGFDGGTFGTAGDSVWSDVNGDGDVDAGEPGIGGVTINLIQDTNGDGLADPDGADNIFGTADDEPIIATTTSAADGSYLFSGLSLDDGGGDSDADYVIDISDIDGILDGLTKTSGTPGVNNNSQDDPYAFDLSAGSPAEEAADFGYAGGGGTGSIGTSVWHDLDMDGVRDAGEPPIEGVTIDVYLDVNGDGVLTPGLDNRVRTVTTDANGGYELKGLPYGNYLVDVTDAAGVLTGFTKTSGSAGTDENSQADPYAVTLSSGLPNNVTADFGYRDDDVSTALTISGTVFVDADVDGQIDFIDLDSDGVYDTNETASEDLVANATVELYRVVNGRRFLVGRETTDVNGFYEFDDLPPGTYEVEIITDGTAVDGFQQTTQTSNGGVETVTLPDNGDPEDPDTDNSANNNFGFYDGGITTTPVTVSFFRTRGGPNWIEVEWKTATEIGHIGFNILVQRKDGRWKPLNDELIASDGIDSRSFRDYRFESEQLDGATKFFLEDLDIRGRSRYHGPFELGREYGREDLTNEKIDWATISTEHIAKKNARSIALKSGGNGDGVKILVDTNGIYRITFAALQAQGLDFSTAPESSIAVFEGDLAIPVHVVIDPINPLLSYIELVGTGLDTLYTKTNVYVVRVDADNALRAEVDSTNPAGAVPPSYQERLVTENNSIYGASSPSGDPWYDSSILAPFVPTKSFAFATPERLLGTDTISMIVNLWGGTDWARAPDHHVVIDVNGYQVADEIFDGITAREISFAVPEAVLTGGVETLTLTLPGDTGVDYDLVNLDSFEVRYPRLFNAREGYLEFEASADTFEVHELPSDDVVVYRRSPGQLARVTQVALSGPAGNRTAQFAGSGGTAVYIVASGNALGAPELEVLGPPIDITSGEARFLIISHPDFIDGLAPLVDTRRAQGWTVAVVNVEDVYAQFSGHVVDPQAIRLYLDLAKAERTTEAVLLVGGDTYDYHDYLGLGGVSFIPSLYGATGDFVRFAPGDGLIADVDGDEVPDLAIGRFPVRTTDELDSLVARTLQYGQLTYRKSIVAAADDYDTGSAFDFAQASEQLLARVPADWQIDRMYLDTLDTVDAREGLIELMNSGPAITSFEGHSGYTNWAAEGLFDSSDAAALDNINRPILVTQWGCHTTYYVHPENQTLAHKLLLSGNRGAAAVLGATTLTEARSERTLSLEIFRRLFTYGETVGNAILEAKRALAATENAALLDVLVGWNLLGDPTLSIAPADEANALIFADGFESGDTSAW